MTHRRHIEIDDEIITTAAACQLLMLSRQRLNQLATEGWIVRHAPGQWRTFDLVQGYVRFLLEGPRRANKSKADNRLLAARAREIELRTTQRLEKLVARDEFDAMRDGIVELFGTGLHSLPARITCDPVQSRTLEREISGLLERVAKKAAAYK
jgi:hypothetical protein